MSNTDYINPEQPVISLGKNLWDKIEYSSATGQFCVRDKYLRGIQFATLDEAVAARDELALRTSRRRFQISIREKAA